MELARLITRFQIDNVDFMDKYGQVNAALDRYGVSVQRIDQLERATLSTKTRIALEMQELNKLVKDGTLSQEAYNKELERLQRSMGEGTPGKSMGRGVQEWTAYAQQGINATTQAAQLLRGEFDTIGEAANKVANVAQLIPGPWGAAISTIISAVGQLVDFLNHNLIQAQRAVKQEFMAIAGGARTVEQSMRHLEAGVMREGIERIVRFRQVAEQMRNTGDAGNFVQGFLDSINPFAGEGAEARAQGSLGTQAIDARGVEWMQTQMQLRLRGMQELLSNPQLREMREQLAVQEIGGSLLDRPLHMEERSAQRRMMMAMHRGGGGSEERRALGEQQLRQANERLAVMQLIRRTQDETGAQTRTYAEAEARLREQIRISNLALVDDMRRRNAERLDEQFVQQTDRHREQTIKLEDETRVLGSTQSGMSKTFTDRLREQLAVEREVFKLRGEGGTAYQLYARRNQLEAAMEQKLLNEALKQANQLTQQLQTPTEKYEDALDRLNHLFQVTGMSSETYARQLRHLQDTLDNSSWVIQQYNASVQRGVSIVEGFRSPMDKLDDKLYDLANALREDNILWDDYQDAVMRVRAEQDKLNNSMGKTQGILAGSADAMAAITEFQQRIRPLNTSNPWEGLVGAPDRNRGRTPWGGILSGLGAGGVGGFGAEGAGVPWADIAAGFGAQGTGGANQRFSDNAGAQAVRAGVDIGNEILRQILNSINALSDNPEVLPQPAEL